MFNSRGSFPQAERKDFMKDVLGSRKRREAQTWIFFMLAWGTIMLLCGLAIDSGLLYLAKARLSRAVDGAALAAVGNFNRDPNPATNRDDVAMIMRNFSVANFGDLGSIGLTGSAISGGTPSTTTGTNGEAVTTYTYSFNDGTQDPNGQYRRFVQVILNTGAGGAITSATCNARCPVQTFFIGYGSYFIGNTKPVKIGGYSGPSSLVDLKVSSQAVATRNPRLIMVVLDRSASMLQPGGGASGLPPAVVQFLDFFDTSSDYIGIVSFGSGARLEMAMTTNFIIAGTNNLIDAYETNAQGGAEPGVDPEDTNAAFATTGVRRLKFGGQTAADDGIRLAMEQLMANPGFNDPDTVKYMVIFTDGKWNACRTLFAAPGYTNWITVPTADSTHVFSNNATAMQAIMTNGHDPGPWSTTLTADTNLVPVPSLGKIASRSSLPFSTNAMAASDGPWPYDFSSLVNDHTNDTWQSADGINEPFGTPTALVGSTMCVTNTTWTGISANLATNYYTHYVDVWLQPGSTAFFYPSAAALASKTATPYVSDYTNPDQHIALNIPSGGAVELVVPGYITDGLTYDGLDMTYPDNPSEGLTGYPKFRANNYQEAFMWPDDTAPDSDPYTSTSLWRQLMFRNYPNLLTGFYIYRADDPLSSATEPLVDTSPATQRPLYGLGPYYPSAGFYWPFGDTPGLNGSPGPVGVDYDSTYALVNPAGADPDPNYNQANFGGSRHIAYSINMLATSAAPEWAGELFYDSISSGGTNVVSGNGTTSASKVMQSADWQGGSSAYPWMSDFSTVMTNEPTHNTNIVGSPSVWRPMTFNGSNNLVSSGLSGIALYASGGDPANLTGGYVSDGNGHYYRNAMAWSGRPTHYFDFSQSKWIPIADNHDANVQFLQLGYWKAQEYAWHARALGVTIYTVGYGSLVTQAQQAYLAQLANATNTTAGGGSNITFNPNQPIGQQFYATNAAQISNDFFQVGTAINAALTQ